MSDQISLTDLKAKRAAMTQGARESLCAPDLRAAELAIRLVASGPKACAVSASECLEITEAVLAVYGSVNSPGIVATHNAADVLIEIAEAALAYEQAKKDAAVVRFAFRGGASDADCRKIEAHDNDEIRCHDAYVIALAKVKP